MLLARCAAVAAALLVAAPAAAATPAPAGYVRIVGEPAFATPGGYATGGSIACPAGRVPIGGGVGSALGSAVPGEDINTSAPTSVGWYARYNNRAGAALPFVVDVICAKQPVGYRIVHHTVANPAVTTSSAVATCPKGTVVLSGGLLSTVDRSLGQAVSAYPSGIRKFTVRFHNGTTSAEQLTAYAVCAQKPVRYAVVAVPDELAGPDSRRDAASCPAGSSVVGGGAQYIVEVAGGSLGSLVDGSRTAWRADYVDTEPNTTYLQTYAICAA